MNIYGEVFDGIARFASECESRSTDSKDEALTALAMIEHQIDAYVFNIKHDEPPEKDIEFME